MKNTVRLKDYNLTAHFQGYPVRNLPIELERTWAPRLVNHITECVLKDEYGDVVTKAYMVCSRPIDLPPRRGKNETFDTPDRNFGRRKALERALELKDSPDNRRVYGFGVSCFLTDYLPMDRDYADFSVYNDSIYGSEIRNFLMQYGVSAVDQDG